MGVKNLSFTKAGDGKSGTLTWSYTTPSLGTNWGAAVYQDGVSIGLVTAPIASMPVWGLTPGVKYTWRVRALTEGLGLTVTD